MSEFGSDELVSIITPMYNSEQTVEQTIGSVLAQSYSNWEMVIVDDCSTDNSVKIVERIQRTESRIKLIRNETSLGPAGTRNRAIECALGRFIAFLDSDDVWKENKLTVQIDYMLRKNVPFVCSAYQRVSSKGKLFGMVQPPAQMTYSDLLKHNRIGCLTAVYDTKNLGKVYMPEILKRQDLALWLRLVKKTNSVHCIQECLADYTIDTSGSVSRSKLAAAKFQWKLYREVEGFGVVTSGYYFFNYLVRNLYLRGLERFDHTNM